MAIGKRIETPQFVVDLVRRALAEKSGNQTAGEPVPVSQAGQRFLKGVGRPTKDALARLAAYLGVSAGWFSGNFLTKQGRMEFYVTEPSVLCARCGGELQTSPEGCVQVLADGTEIEGDGIIRVWPCAKCCQGL
jgi:transcriptional regulator with XRE-family HTH domain